MAPLVSGGVALVLAISVIALAYGTQPPSLGVAEFAPSAQKAIEAPATTLPTDRANGTGAGSRRSTTTTANPAVSSVDPSGSASSAPITRVSRSRRCYGDPPRQIDDPMAPACLAAMFEGDNGGATSTGVTATEIRVAVPIFSGRGLDAALEGSIRSLFDYFNQSFELYGRRMVPIFMVGDATTGLTARAHAADIASRSVFAAVNASQDWGSPQPALPQTLAHNRVITITQNLGLWWTDRTLFDALHPYVWSIYPSSEDIQVNVAAYACSALAGQAARYAGDSSLRSRTRRFAVVSVGRETAPPTRALIDGLAACSGAEPIRAEWTSLSDTTALQTAMAQAKSSGATTLVCVCEGVYGMNNVPAAAKNAGFFPEWILTPSIWGGNNEDEWVVQDRRSGTQLPAPIRLSAGPRLTPMQARPWFRALLATNPAIAGDTSRALFTWSTADFVYNQLLVLASGIQGAGPALTPDSFSQALMTTQFPNPGAGQAPYWQPSAGFGVGDHSFYDDYTVGWWSDDADAVNQPVTPRPRGSWCYVDQGARFRPGTYPTSDQMLFDAGAACR